MSRYLVSVLLLCAVAPLARAATISVRVTGPSGAAMPDAVVWAVPVGRDVPPPDRTAVMDQKNRMFVPRVLPVQAGTAVSFPNSDNIRHQVYSFSSPKTFQLPLYAGTPAKPLVFDKPGIVVLGCNIHDRMIAYIVVVDSPWFGKSDSGGALELKDLREGEYRLFGWHEGMRSPVVLQPLTVAANERRTLAVQLPPR